MNTYHAFQSQPVASGSITKSFQLANTRVIGGQLFAGGVGTANGSDGLRVGLTRGGQTYSWGIVDGNTNLLMGLSVGGFSNGGGAGGNGIWVPLDIKVSFPTTFYLEIVPSGGGTMTSWFVDLLLFLA